MISKMLYCLFWLNVILISCNRPPEYATWEVYNEHKAIASCLDIS